MGSRKASVCSFAREYKAKIASIALAVMLALTGIFWFGNEHSKGEEAAAAPTAIVNGNFEYPGRTSSLIRHDYTIVDPVRGQVFWPDFKWRPITGWNFNKFAWLSNQTEDFASNKGRCAKGVEVQEDITGNMYGELTASQAGTYIYQDISTTPDSVYKWSLKHTSKDKDYNDKMSVMIGTTSSQTAQYATRTTKNTVETATGTSTRSTVISTRANNTGVRDHSKQWCTYTGAYYVKKGQTLTRFCFKNVASRNDTVGNLVDDISFTIAHPLYYDTNGGTSNIPSPTANDYAGYYPVNTNITLTSTQPTRSGYTFMGWSDSALSPATNKDAYDSNKSKLITSVKMPSGGKTVYAVWAKNPTITFKDGQGNVMKTMTVAPGGNGTAPAFPTNKTGYTSSSWNKGYTGIYADTVVDAVWTPNKYNVVYNANGGAGTMPNQQMTYDVAANLSTNTFTRLDYDWDGWNSAADNTGTGYAQSQSVKNLTSVNNGMYPLYAQWSPHTNAKMTFTKSTDKPAYTVGDMVEYSFTIENIGDITLGSIKFTDEMLGIDNEEVAERLDCGQSITFTRSYGPLIEFDAIEHKVDNTATASAVSFLPELADPDAVSASASVPVVSEPSLIIEKIASNKAMEDPHPGDEITYDITFTNQGNISLHNISPKDVLSNGKELAISIPKTELAPGESMSTTVSYKIEQADIDAGAIGNTITATAQDPSRNDVIEAVPGGDETTLARNPSFTFEKIANMERANIGNDIEYKFVVSNTGNTTLYNFALNDELLSIDGKIIADVLAPGDSAEFTATYGPVAQSDAVAGSVVNTATMSADVPEGAPAVEPGNASSIVYVDARPSLKISKTPSSSLLNRPHAGDKIEYTIAVENTGNMDLSNIEIEDVLSNGQHLSLPEYRTDLAVGEALTIQVPYILTQDDIDAGSISNTATVRSMSPAGEDPTDETAPVPTEFANAADISLEISANKDIGEIGDSVSYVAVIENTGNVSLHNISLDEALTGYNQVVVSSLAPGEKVEVPLRYNEITQGDAVSKEISCTGKASGISPDDESVEDVAEIRTPIVSRPSIHIVSSVDNSHLPQAHPGDSLVYTYTATNTGNIYLDGVLVPSFMNGTTHFPIDFPLSRFEAGTSETFDKTYVITQEDIDRGYVENKVNISGIEPVDKETVDGNENIVRTTIDRHPSVSIDKTSDRKTANIGDTITYTLTVSNTGDVSLHDIFVGDELAKVEHRKAADVLAPGETVSLEVLYGPVSEKDAIAGAVKNVATVSSSAPEGLEDVNSVGTNTVRAASSPSVHIANAVDKTSIDDAQAGDMLVYTYTATNTGTIYLEGVQVPSFMEGSLAFPLQFPQEILHAGEQAIFDKAYQITQDDIDRGYVENVVSIHGIDPSTGATVQGNASKVRTELVRHPSYVLEKVSDKDAAKIGETVNYEITVENTGNTTLRDIVVDDILAGVKGKKIADAVLPGEKVSFACSYGPVSESDAAAGSIVNTACASATPPEGAGEEIRNVGKSTVSVEAAPSLSFSKKADTSSLADAHAGDAVRWLFDIKNVGDITVQGLGVSDEMLESAGYEIVLGKTFLAPGENATAFVDYVLTQADIDAGHISNTAYASATSTQSGNPQVKSPESTWNVDIERHPSISLDKQVSQMQAVIGDVLEYTVMFENTGNTTLHDIQLDDATAGIIEIEGELLPGESKTMKFSLPVDEKHAIEHVIESSASVLASAPGQDEQVSAQAHVKTLVESHPSLTATKTGTLEPGIHYVGDVITWKMIIENTGDITVSNIEVVDDMLDERGISFDIDPDAQLAPGETLEIEASYSLTQEDIDSGHVYNSAFVSAFALDGTKTKSDESSFDVELDRKSSLAVSKSANTKFIANAEPGDIIEYEIAIENTGNTTMKDIEIIDMLEGIEISPSHREELLPGESFVGKGKYAITQQDIESGHVKNTAYADYSMPSIEDEGTLELLWEEKESDCAVAETVLVAPEDTSIADELVEIVLTGDNAWHIVIVAVLALLSTVSVALIRHRRK